MTTTTTTATTADHEELVARARGGDRRALDQLLREMKDLVYNLAIRMLGSPADAEDAAQEILIRLVTGLDSFRGESSFRTWVYRVATNQLLTTRKRNAETYTESFEVIAEFLDKGIASGLPPSDDQRLVAEAKMTCTSRMLLALDRDHRVAFILGEILELASEEAAAVLGISSDAFRKRLSRARTRMEEFAEARCGILDPAKPCRCGTQAANAVKNGLLDPSRLTWATHRTIEERTADVAEIDQLMKTVELMRSIPKFASPDSLIDGLRELIDDRSGNLLA